MWDLFHHPLREEEYFFILGFLLIGGWIGLQYLRTTLAHFREGREQDAVTALKMEMIQRGMSPTEIERVLLAKGESSPSLAKELGRVAGEAARKAMS